MTRKKFLKDVFATVFQTLEKGILRRKRGLAIDSPRLWGHAGLKIRRGKLTEASFLFHVICLPVCFCLVYCPGVMAKTIAPELSAGGNSDIYQYLETYEQLATAGDAHAQNQLGNLYYRGELYGADYQEAKKWYKKSALQGNMYAQYSLGNLYYHGHGTPRDADKAMFWLHESCQSGYVKACVTQAWLEKKKNGYGEAGHLAKNLPGIGEGAGSRSPSQLTGINAQNPLISPNYVNPATNDSGSGPPGPRGGDDDIISQLEWAALHGDSNAQVSLGYAYYKGRGVPRDYPQARRWYEMAATSGNAVAENRLGNMYYNGHGVPRDYTAARNWYERAAARGNKFAQFNLANFYYRGQGGTRNPERAKSWLEQSCRNGFGRACVEFRNLFGHSPPELAGASTQFNESIDEIEDNIAGARL